MSFGDEEYYEHTGPFDDEDASMLLIYTCYACDAQAAERPSRTPFVHTDRKTRLPLDVAYDPVTRTVSKRTYTPAEKAAAEQSPLCHACATVLKKTGQLHIRYTPPKEEP